MPTSAQLFAPITEAEFCQRLAEARAGSCDAVKELVGPIAKVVLQEARRLIASDVRWRICPEDLAQHALVDILENLVHFHGQSVDAFRAWALAILRHKVRDAFRCLRRRRNKGCEDALDHARLLSVVMDALVDAHASPDSAAVQHEDLDALRQRLQRLSKGELRLLRMRFEDTLPFDEIGRRLGVSADAARMNVNRLLHRLQPPCGAPP